VWPGKPNTSLRSVGERWPNTNLRSVRIEQSAAEDYAGADVATLGSNGHQKRHLKTLETGRNKNHETATLATLHRLIDG